MIKSMTYRRMLEERKGYRSEQYGGSGIRNLKEVLLYEIRELGNLDVLYYVKSEYGILDDFEIRGEELSYVMKNAYSLEEGLIRVDELLYEKGIKEAEKFVEEIVSFAAERTGNENPTGLWLTDEYNVKRYESEEGEAVMVDIPEKAIVLSDLSEEGCLFAF